MLTNTENNIYNNKQLISENQTQLKPLIILNKN